MKRVILNLLRFPEHITEKRPGLRWLGIPFLLLMGFGTLLAAEVVTFASPLLALRWCAAHPGAAVFTTLAISLVSGVLWALSGSLFVGGLLTTVPCMVLAFVNCFKLRINGAPLEIADFTLAAKVPELMTLSKGNLALPPWGAASIAGCVVMLLVALWVGRALRPGRAGRISCGLVCLALTLCLCLAPKAQLRAMRSFGMLPDSRIGQTYSNEINGVLGGLYRAWALRNGVAPEHYSAALMQELLDQTRKEATDAGEGVRPSVILILSESFFDLTSLPGVGFSEDPVPCFHALAEDAVSGTFYTSYCGYNTGIIERSILSGLHSRYLPYGSNICYMDEEDTGRFTALPELFRAEGYGTLALHTYSNRLYNRAEAFPVLGFDRVLFEDEFYDETRLKGGYLSDDYFADLIIRYYEEMTAQGDPAFIFGISMENHQPYPPDKFDETEIAVSAPALTEREIGMLESVAQGTYDADASLGKLAAYFAAREEPVLLVFFGDHRPSLPTAYEQTIYQKLGLCDHSDEFYWTPEQRAVMFSTDYLAWANYDAFDPALFGENVASGDMLLGSDLLNWVGVRQTLFWQMIGQLGDSVASFTENGFVAADGTPSLRPPAECAEIIRRVEAVMYDAFYGERYITDAMNTYG